MEAKKSNKILIVIDGSYFMYYVLYSAVNQFYQNHRIEYDSLIKPPDETDQESLPSLLVSDSFKKELKRTLMAKCEYLDSILHKNFQDEMDNASSFSFIFALDDFLSNSFRKEIYPEYKATRKLKKKSYTTSDIHNYIVNVLFPELDILGRFGYHVLKVDGAEGDDVIACIMKNFSDEYPLKILIASDHDFCQLNDIRQFDLRGNEVHQTVTVKGEEKDVDSKTSLLMKIIMGDSSDNIPSIGEKIGPVKAYKYANDKEALRTLLFENKSSAKQFMINRNLIDFEKIPNELSLKIINEAGKILKEDESKNKDMDSVLQNVMEL